MIPALLFLLALSAPGELDDLPVAQLEQRFGRNLLTPDPLGLGPPENVRDDTVLHRWYGADPPAVLNGLVTNDGNLVDSLLVYCLLDLALPHKRDPDRWQPGLADYAGMSEDGLSVTVRIARGVTWQYPEEARGDPSFSWLDELYAQGKNEVTAEDFAFTHRLILDPEAGVTHLRPFFEGSTLEVLDRHVFRLSFDEWKPEIDSLALSWQQVLPKFLYTRDRDGKPIPEEQWGKALRNHWALHQVIGYGPYAFVRREPGVVIELRRREDFPVFRPAIREIHWQIVRDGEQCVRRLLAGELDFTVLMPRQYRKWVVEKGDASPFRDGTFAAKAYDKLEYSYFGWNCRRPPFDDARVRRAMTYSFDRKRIFESVFDGFGALVDSPVFESHPFHHDGLEPYEFDLDKAAQLLEDAGWRDEDEDGVREKRIGGNLVPLSFTMISFAGSPEYDAVLAIWRDDLLSIGVEMEVEALPWPAMLDRVYRRREFDAFAGIVAMGWNPDFYYRWHSRAIEEGANYVGYRNPEVDELSERFRREREPEARRKIALRIQEILHRDQPYTFFMRRRRLAVYVPWLRNVEFGIVRPQLLSFGWYDGRPR